MMQVTRDKHYTASFSVDQSPERAYAAVNDPRAWWSQEITGVTDQVGAEFRHRFQDVHRCTLRVTELVPGHKVVWHVVDNFFNFVDDQSEWQGTDIVFEISETAGGAEVRFTHIGLTPQDDCYDVCSNAWGGYLDGSLKSLITTGLGRPNPKEDGRVPEHQDAASVERAKRPARRRRLTPTSTRRPVMSTLTPNSMLLGTTRPAELRDWYRRTLAPEHTGEGPIDLGGFLLVIDRRADLAAKNDQPGRMILNFHVDDFAAVEARLQAEGVEWIAPAEDRASGRFATFADPDGNYLQIIQFFAGHP